MTHAEHVALLDHELVATVLELDDCAQALARLEAQRGRQPGVEAARRWQAVMRRRAVLLLDDVRLRHGATVGLRH